MMYGSGSSMKRLLMWVIFVGFMLVVIKVVCFFVDFNYYFVKRDEGVS